MDRKTAAKLMGAHLDEIVDVEDAPAGTVIKHRDGTTYLHVDPDGGMPDGDGKTGLMFLAAPHDNYAGTFPVYTMPALPAGETVDAAEVEVGRDDGTVDPLAGLTQPELVAYAAERGVKVDKKASVDEITAAIRAIEAQP